MGGLGLLTKRASSIVPILQGGDRGVTKWGRTSQRTSTYKPRDISNATGGTMTTRTGEPASRRESYTTYLQGRACEVRANPGTTAFSPSPSFPAYVRIERGKKKRHLLLS